MKTAVVFGATGFVGSHLLSELLANPDYTRVTAVVRRPLALHNPKLKTVIGDLNTLPNMKAEITGDEVFIALGTTTKKTPDRKAYYAIDHDYPVRAAALALENGARAVFLVSSIGADANSHFFYIKTKGETERDIGALDFPHAHIFQPSMILGHRQEERAMEKTLIKVWDAIDPILIGGMNRYRGIDGKDLARAMVRAAGQAPVEKFKIYRWREMRDLLQDGSHDATLNQK